MMTNGKEVAQKYSMDIPHVSAVELPLVVANKDKAIEMLGGKEKIAKIINSVDKSIGSNTNSGSSNSESHLELRLRDDPFHHPIQSLLSVNEKVLLKVSIPKRCLPKDYYTNPSNYTVRDLISKSNENGNSQYKAHPVGIIDKTFLFKAMADFQVSTKNNDLVQDFNLSVLNAQSYSDLERYIKKHNNFTSLLDYKDPSTYANQDHQLPPPPIFSPIRFPFDYKYQKNPLTSIIKDEESGEMKVISKKGTLKLHTIIVNFHATLVPSSAAPELIEIYEKLKSSKDLQEYSFDATLLRCIEWLRSVFDIKPIWLRKQLEDIAHPDLKRFIKQALPHVSYIFKSGPWRFCNVKFGVSPKSDRSFWEFQSEYFRIPGLHFNSNPKYSPRRLVPKTVKERKGDESLTVSEYLLFTGDKLPLTVTYQVGDIIDPDIENIIEKSLADLGDKFYREVPDFQDGWVNRQTMETIRRIIRYKLSRIVNEEPIDHNKVTHLINKEFNDNDDDNDISDIKSQDKIEGDVSDENEGDGDDEVVEENNDQAAMDIDPPEDYENDVISQIESSEIPTTKSLRGLVGLIKQDSLNFE